MYKLVASDVDGTLVREGNSHLNPELLDYILKLKEKGIRFAAASGRQYESIRHAFAPIRDDILFIADNGAFVYEKDQMLVCNTFPVETYQMLMTSLNRMPGVYIMISSLEGTFTSCRNDEFVRMMSEGYGLEMTRTDTPEKLDIHVSKIGVYCADTDIIQLADEGRRLFNDAADIFISGKLWVDFLPKGVNKGAGLRWIQQNLEIGREQTIAFGDQNNDISMFHNAGASYAVCSARDEAKAAALHVMEEGPDNDGVLHVLQGIFGN